MSIKKYFNGIEMWQITLSGTFGTLVMAVEVHKKEITSHGREVARTRPISHVTRASYSSHGQSGSPWGDFPPFPTFS